MLPAIVSNVSYIALVSFIDVADNKDLGFFINIIVTGSPFCTFLEFDNSEILLDAVFFYLST